MSELTDRREQLSKRIAALATKQGELEQEKLAIAREQEALAREESDEQQRELVAQEARIFAEAEIRLQTAAAALQTDALDPVADAREALAPTLKDLADVFAPALQKAIAQLRPAYEACRALLATATEQKVPLPDVVARFLPGVLENARVVLDERPRDVQHVHRLLEALTPTTVNDGARGVPKIRALIAMIADVPGIVPSYHVTLVTYAKQISDHLAAAPRGPADTWQVAPHQVPRTTQRAASALSDGGR